MMYFDVQYNLNKLYYQYILKIELKSLNMSGVLVINFISKKNTNILKKIVLIIL